MSKELTVVLLGAWVIILPYLGFPGTWRTALLVLSGLAIMATGFFLRAESVSRGVVKKTDRHPFVDNGASFTGTE